MRARVLVSIAVALFAVHLGAGSSVAQSPAPPPDAVFGADVDDRLVYQPRNFLIPPGFLIRKIDWASWSTVAAVGTGRYRLPKGAVPGLKKKFISVKLKLSQPKDCEVYDGTSGNLLGTVRVFDELFTKSLGKPGKCAVFCSTDHVNC